MDVSFSGLLSYIEERADKLLNSGEYNKAASSYRNHLYQSSVLDPDPHGSDLLALMDLDPEPEAI
jgi:hypothetical protein